MTDQIAVAIKALKRLLAQIERTEASPERQVLMATAGAIQAEINRMSKEQTCIS